MRLPRLLSLGVRRSEKLGLFIPSWASDRIAKRVKAFLECPDSNADITLYDAARVYSAWPVYSDIGGTLLLDENGIVYLLDNSTSKVAVEHSPEWKTTAWVKAAEKEPELKALLPKRSAGAPDCPHCGGQGFVQITPEMRAGCGVCWGLGWTDVA